MDVLSFNIFLKFLYQSEFTFCMFVLEYTFLLAVLSQWKFTSKIVERNIKIKNKSYFH